MPAVITAIFICIFIAESMENMVHLEITRSMAASGPLLTQRYPFPVPAVIITILSCIFIAESTRIWCTGRILKPDRSVQKPSTSIQPSYGCIEMMLTTTDVAFYRHIAICIRGLMACLSGRC